jgi:hypothetical protein
MLAKHVTALVRRDMAETVPAAVFEHEVEILKDIHGEGSVTVQADGPDYPAIEIDTEEEFGRLMQAYGTNEQGQPYVERVFGRTARGLEAYAHRPSKAAGKAAGKAAAESAAA